MIITVKTLQQKTFKIEIGDSESVRCINLCFIPEAEMRVTIVCVGLGL